MGLSLAGRIFALIGVLMAITLAGGATTIWYANAMQKLFTGVIEKDVNSLRAAEELETALAIQKGFVTYYFLHGDETWLEQLEAARKQFETRLDTARETAATDDEKLLLNQIEQKYLDYKEARDQVIALYKAGRRQEGARQHWEVRGQFTDILELCERYKNIQVRRIAQAQDQSQERVHRVSLMAITALSASLLLSAALALVLSRQVLMPIRRLAREASPAGEGTGQQDEVEALSDRVYGLIEDRDHTREELSRSRELLVHAEKMAAVGKLAAGVAHSIRNPLTSVKMRLFSLERGLDLAEVQKEDFSVISQEIRNVDNIVQNFLEFSRPPKLRMQSVSPSDVVDAALLLMRHRLELHDIEVEIKREFKLPVIKADPELLKEVLVNLLNNACDAMGNAGRITISEDEADPALNGRGVKIEVSDSGPGVPASIADKLFEPFFSTKEEGTGLGLAISRRIIEQHGGTITLRSAEGKGAAFVIVLPLDEGKT